MNLHKHQLYLLN